MGVRVFFSTITTDRPNTLGFIIGYRIKGTTGDYTVVNIPHGQTVEFTTTDPAGTLYEGYIKGNCGEGFVAPQYLWVSSCHCPSGYTAYPDGSGCYTVDTQAATIVHSGYCLATSTNGNYSMHGTRIYDGDQTASYISLLSTYWQNNNGVYLEGSTGGPMNSCSVWVDSDCDGTKDSLTAGQKTTIAYNYYNSGVDKVIYIGVGGDNSFLLTVNDITIANSDILYGVGSYECHRIWSIFKVTLSSGNNFINVIGQGDGSVNDAIGMIVYDNTSSQLQTATQDSDLNIIFNTKNLRGTTYKVATCPEGYGMDASYNCNKITNSVCNS